MAQGAVPCPWTHSGLFPSQQGLQESMWPKRSKAAGLPHAPEEPGTFRGLSLVEGRRRLGNGQGRRGRDTALQTRRGLVQNHAEHVFVGRDWRQSFTPLLEKTSKRVGGGAQSGQAGSGSPRLVRGLGTPGQGLRYQCSGHSK